MKHRGDNKNFNKNSHSFTSIFCLSCHLWLDLYTENRGEMVELHFATDQVITCKLAVDYRLG